MRQYPGRLAAAAFVSVSLAACAGHQPSPALAGVAEPDGQILAALDIGMRAEIAADATALMAAASLLESSGARPAPGEADLQQIWYARAAELGETVPPARGRIAGPAYRNGTLAGGEAAVLRDSFHSGRAARVSLQARGGGMLRLSIRRGAPGSGAGARETVCETLASAAPVSCQWVPVWSEPFTIEISNLTGGQVAYSLITN